MGNYVFSTRTLLRLLHDDAAEPNSNHDFGRDILPKLAGKAEMYAYDFQTNRIPGEPPDARSLLARRGHHRRLLRSQYGPARRQPGAEPLTTANGPLRTTSYPDPPAKFTFDEENRRGQAIDSHRLRRLHPLRRHGAQFGAGPRREGACRRAGGRLRDPRQLRHRAPRANCAAPSWIRTSACPRTP